VISNKSAANGLNRAKAASIPTTYHNLVSGKYQAAGEKDQAVEQAARERHDADLAKIVLADKPDLIMCAGWMHILSPYFLDPVAENKVPVINLHPALPDRYDGVDAMKRAYDYITRGSWSTTRLA
jgi:phosphoribosylglycinamide formyltransferase